MTRNILIVLLFAAFAVEEQNVEISTPDWYKNPPKSVRRFYGAGVGTSIALDNAEQKAMVDANAKLAEQVGKVEKVSKHGVEKKTVEATLTDVKVEKKFVVKKGKDVTVYVLLSMKKPR